MHGLEKQNEVIKFLISDSKSNRYHFNQILIGNKNNIPLSIILFRDYLRCNSDRGKICTKQLGYALDELKIEKLNQILNEAFLDIICEDTCYHVQAVLKSKNISCIDFHNAHLKRVERPLLRILSSL